MRAYVLVNATRGIRDVQGVRQPTPSPASTTSSLPVYRPIQRPRNADRGRYPAFLDGVHKTTTCLALT
jgi:hypothetical protein